MHFKCVIRRQYAALLNLLLKMNGDLSIKLEFSPDCLKLRCVCVCVCVRVRVCVKVRHLHWGDNSPFFTAKPNLNMQDPQGYLLKEENQYNSLGTISVSLSSTHTLTYIRTHTHWQ